MKTTLRMLHERGTGAHCMCCLHTALEALRLHPGDGRKKKGRGAEITRKEGNMLLKPVIKHWLKSISLIATAPGAKTAGTSF